MSETTNDESSKLVSAEKKIGQDSVGFSARKKREIEEWAETTALRHQPTMHWDYFNVETYEKERAAHEAEFQAKVLKEKERLIDVRYYWEEQFKLLTPYERMVARLYLGFDKKTDYKMHPDSEIACLLNITEEKAGKILKNISRKIKEEKDKNEPKQ